MGTKTISIMNDVHELLISRKQVTESFSDVIRKEFTKKRSIMEFAGAWKNISDKEAEEIKKNARKIREGIGKDILKRVKRVDKK